MNQFRRDACCMLFGMFILAAFILGAAGLLWPALGGLAIAFTAFWFYAKETVHDQR